MNSKDKITKLKALKEQYVATQARLETARKLEESAKPASMSKLLESELERAELILAAKDFQNKLQGIAEDLAKMQADGMPLADNMKGIFGPELAQSFESALNDGLQSGLAAIRASKDGLNNAILGLEGKPVDTPVDNDMAAPVAEPTDELGGDIGGEADFDLDGELAGMGGDEFGGAEASAGPSDEPLGRARRESIENTKMSLQESGRRLLVQESLDDLIGWVLSEAATQMAPKQFHDFARKVAVKGARSPEKLAGWIGQRKYGAGLGAQLANPMLDTTSAEAIEEGRSFKRSEDDEDVADLKKDSKAKRDARQNTRKVDDKVEEGKSFKRSEDDEDVADLRKDSKAKRDARRSSKDIDDKVEEGKSFKKSEDGEDTADLKKDSKAKRSARKNTRKVDDLAEAIAEKIRANIAECGKGKAAQAIKECALFEEVAEGEPTTIEAVLEAFEAAYGTSPAKYSIAQAKLAEQELSVQDKKAAGAIVGKIAGQMATDKSTATRSVQSEISKLDPTERSAAQRMVQKMKSDGKDPKNVGDFVNGASDLDENINAAQWPISDTGQYAGTPFETDYGKLKAKNTVKNDSKPVADTPASSDKPEGSDSEMTTKVAALKKETAPKSEAAPKQESAEEKPEGEKKGFVPFKKKGE